VAKQGINTLKNWFKRGLKPLQQQFYDWLDSYWHKDEAIPIQSIDGLEAALNSIPSQDSINTILELVLPEVINANADYVYNLKASKRLQSMVFIPSVDETIKVGAFNGTEEIMVETPLTAGQPFILDCAVYAIADISIYINGIAGPTQIIIYKR
jgi:hypothetical protein